MQKKYPVSPQYVTDLKASYKGPFRRAQRVWAVYRRVSFQGAITKVDPLPPSRGVPFLSG